MSLWGTLEARFWFAEPLPDWYRDRLLETAPKGSEGDVDLHEWRGGDISAIAAVPLGPDAVEYVVGGRCRDVDDTNSPGVLAWFVNWVSGPWTAVYATMRVEYDGGPRYRYEWRDERLNKLRGILDL